MTDAIVIFHSGLFFCPFTPHSPKKSKFQKNEKKSGDIINLHIGTKNHDYTVLSVCKNMPAYSHAREMEIYCFACMIIKMSFKWISKPSR